LSLKYIKIVFLRETKPGGGMMLFILIWIVAGTGSFPADQDKKKPAADRYVVIITIDGFPAQALWDEEVTIPVIRELAEEGAHAVSMRPSNPSLTWSNHTTLITGRDARHHHVLYNAKLERTDGGLPVRLNPRKDKSELASAETLYDAAFEAGLTTAAINWPVTRNAGTLHDSFPDTPDNVEFMTDQLRWELYDEDILDDMTSFALWKHGSAARDELWTRAAIHLIENRMPNLLLLHLLHVDHTHHRQGVNTSAGRAAMEHADEQVRRILEALELAGVREKTTIFVVSDHGFANTPQTILPNVLLYRAGLIEISEDDRVVGGKAQAVANGGFAMIYLDDPDDEDTLREVRKLFEEQEGVRLVITPDEYPKYGLPQPSESDQAGELAVFSRPGYGMSGTLQGEEVLVKSELFGFNPGHHGFLSDTGEMGALFVASGYGIRGDIKLGVIDNRSVAPTSAYLLGLTLDEADGELLHEILIQKYAGD
jgi:predicted AlkP superfamily pyrophosphatase or phosphodiesterase